ncbi:uncharacterized protein BDR25DRAFT_259087 [Lindgomyces ingoldianus]|uniref:Uncharacterized protein n=1 Tax=Lindgomyces ingoldianus TaxID=673940 RepID=A0ACB6R1F4_9PLEO|nr:uncharacterized protein BDR25DRAFT_259087 [Lindgomyces ingoldianus]KAF2472615.1 hypothetical protein BDR25DRAFT_259087 [Lindgomyces ingoldianus]
MKLGRMDEAEEMYQRALRGYEKAIGLDRLSTYIPALNTMWGFASLSKYQRRVEDARSWYSKTLSGYEKVLGKDHPKCQTLRDTLAALGEEREYINSISESETVDEHARPETTAHSSTKPVKLASKRHRVLQKLGWKRKV